MLYSCCQKTVYVSISDRSLVSVSRISIEQEEIDARPLARRIRSARSLPLTNSHSYCRLRELSR
jgi:hypothetical protein